MFGISVNILFSMLLLSQANADPDTLTDALNNDGGSEIAAVQETTTIGNSAEQALENEVAQPAQAAIAEKRVEKRNPPHYPHNLIDPNDYKNIKLMHAPGRMAYKRSGAVLLSLGSTIAGVLLAYPLLSTSNLLKNNNTGRLSLYIGGTILLAGALGFGPSMGQLTALGKNSNYVIPVLRTGLVIAVPLITMYFMGFSGLEDNFVPDDYYNAFKIATLASSISIGLIWGIVDIAMTPANIRRYIRRYEKRAHIYNLRSAPFAMENGGGLAVSFRF